jgi:hypothetical protein
MKRFITIIAAMLFSGTWLNAQEDFVPKTDGTKYYILIYDGAANEKVLDVDLSAAWNSQITYADFFDGSNTQLWRFGEAAEMDGYYNVNNLGVSEDHFLKSWNWLAYLEAQTGSREGDEETDLELLYTIKHAFDGWQILETPEKPDGLYGIPYTPGADALNIGENKIAGFGFKSADITPENAAFKVFKFVEFDPISLFESAIERGQEMYDTQTGVSGTARADLFYELEKARETRVFGTEAEILAFQERLDNALKDFTDFLQVVEAIADARTFIDNSGADEDVKEAFGNVLNRAEDLLASDPVDYSAIPTIIENIEGAKDLVDAIVFAVSFYDETEDAETGSGIMLAIDNAKGVLANPESDAETYAQAVSLLGKTTEFAGVITEAQTLVQETDGFEEAKQELGLAIDVAIDVLNSPGVTVEDLEMALANLQAAIVTFNKALEAGDVVVELENPGFEEEFYRWNTDSDTDWLPYTENKGVDGSKNMTIWNSANYTFVASQSIEGIPNGTYQLSVMSTVSNDSTIALFAESGENSSVLPLAFEEWSLTERMLEIEVTDGTLTFGIRGNGEGNEIPANHWGTFDNFELKWLSNVGLVNPGFENEFEGWTNTTDTGWLPYTENKGVDGSKNMTIWNSVNYTFRSAQTVTGLQDGTYQLSVMSTVSNDSTISLYATSGGETVELPMAFEEWTLTKRRIQIDVTGGSLEFGIKGSGENDMIPANHWGTFDNFEVLRLPDIPLVNPGFEEEFAGWTNVSDTEWLPYTENKGVDGSKSVTFWNSVDYHISTSQQITSLVNGSYEVNAWTMPSVDNSFTLFGKSGSETAEEVIMFNGWELTQDKVLAVVSDGSLEIGIRGSGEDNMVPANHWIVFDAFEVKIKSVIPEYIEGNSLMKEMTTGSDLVEKEKNAVVFWQKNKTLNVRSDEILEDLAVYSITGAVVNRMKVNSTYVTVPMNPGIYIVRVSTRKGGVETQKVIIH